MSTELINGLMPREVVRVFTAGTVIEPGMLEAERNNYLAAVVFEDGRAGPVSYTHLDVYKRQGQRATFRRQRPALPVEPRRAGRARAHLPALL